MKFVCGLLYSMSCCCLIVSLFFALSTYFALCYVPVNCFMFFNYSFYICSLVLYVLLSILSVLCFCIVLCNFIFVYNSTDHCPRAETQFQLINIIYHPIPVSKPYCPPFRCVFHIDDHRNMIRMRHNVATVYSCHLHRETSEIPRDHQ